MLKCPACRKALPAPAPPSRRLANHQGYRKVKLCCEDVQGTSVLTNFHGMDLTRDKLCSLIKKWQTLIEAQVDVRTTDGYLLRIVSGRRLLR